MTCAIVTAERWRRFLDDRLTREESLLVLEHFAADCADCERLFEQMDLTDEARLRRLFEQTGKVRGAQLTPDRAFDAVMTAVGRPPVEPARRRVGWWTWPLAPAPLAVLGTGLLLALAGALYLAQQQVPEQTEKGGAAATAPAIHLEFAVDSAPPNHAPSVQRGLLGARYANADRLFLHVQTSASGYIYLVEETPRRELSALDPAGHASTEPQPAGSHLFPSNASGLSLETLRGRTTIIAVYSPTPLPITEELLPLIARSVDPVTGAIDRRQLAAANEHITADLIYFDVEG